MNHLPKATCSLTVGVCVLKQRLIQAKNKLFFSPLTHDIDRFDDVLHELKGNPNAPPYCFFTKRLGSELVMKTLVGE